MGNTEESVSHFIERGDAFSLNQACMIVSVHFKEVSEDTFCKLYEALFDQKSVYEIVQVYKASSILPSDAIIDSLVEYALEGYLFDQKEFKHELKKIIQIFYEWLLKRSQLEKFIKMYKRFAIEPDDNYIYLSIALCESLIESKGRGEIRQLEKELCHIFNLPHNLFDDK